MMMPANYSVIAENEMTYVVGGGLIADVLPAIMTTENWKTFNTNLVKIVGNTFIPKAVDATLGVMFGGSWASKTDGETMFGYDKDNKKYTGTITGWYAGHDVLNGIMGTLGGLAAVYTLGQDAVKTVQSTIAMGIEGTKIG